MPSTYRRLKHTVFGRPLPSERLEDERLNKRTALAVLSSHVQYCVGTLQVVPCF